MFRFQSISVFPVYWTSAPYPFIHPSPAQAMNNYPAPVASTDEMDTS